MVLPSKNTIPVIDVIERGFFISYKRWPISILLSLLGVCSLSLALFIKHQWPTHSYLNGLIFFLGLLFSQVFLGGLIFFLYRIHKNLSCSLQDALLKGIQKLPLLLITIFLYSLIVFIGTVAFIFPGIILSILCVFGFILIYIDNYDPIFALTSSFYLCKDQFFSSALIIFTLNLFIVLGNLLGLLFGYLVSITFPENTDSFFFTNLIILTLVNAFIIPIAYGIMISLLHELKLKQVLF